MSNNKRIILISLFTMIILIFHIYVSDIIFSSDLAKRFPPVLSDGIPCIEIKDFKSVKIVSLPYGKDPNKMGRDELIIKGIKHVSDGHQLSSRSSLVFIDEGKAILFDWHNRNIKNLNLCSETIKKVVPITNFHRLSKYTGKESEENLYCQIYKIVPRLGMCNKNLFILYRSTPSMVKSYIELDPVKGRIIGNKIEKFHIGTRNIIIEKDAAYAPIKRFIDEFKRKHPEFINFSFTSVKDGSLILSIITDKKLFLYRFTMDSRDDPFRFLNELPYNSSCKSEERKVKIFDCSNTFLVFINLGERIVSVNGGFTGDLPGRMIVIDKNSLKIIKNLKVDFTNWDFFTVFNGSIYTWDSRFTTKKFNIYRLKYVGDNPRLKNIFNQKSGKK